MTSTTATAQGVRCGNHRGEKVYHPTTADVRACFQGRTARPVAPSQPAPAGPRNADEARAAANARLANPVHAIIFPASEKQKGFLRDLIGEVLVGDTQERALGMLDNLTSQEARKLIDDMLVMRTSQREMAASQPKAEPKAAKMGNGQRNALVARVMGVREESNFCIIDDEGKARFYRISKRGKRSGRPGTWKIQERVTDMLLPRYDGMLTTVCQAILDQGGAEAAGKRWAELMHRCYECGASLTDTTGNPYYSAGLGPECGSK